ncbi:MAG: DUF2007 domain-containing protein [Gemmatimonadetes bacterium]|nr:DUF2007 domain-containing protein [Gemmatimonadota bacterium]
MPQERSGCPLCGALLEPARCERHPRREARGQCVVCGTPVCELCQGVGGGPHLCPDHESVAVVDGWAQVYTTNDDIEAELIRENLQAEGIQAQVLSQKDHFSFTVALGGLSPVSVLVPADEYGEAQRLIRGHMDARGGVAFACPSCGEAYERGDDICAACGTRLV